MTRARAAIAAAVLGIACGDGAPPDAHPAATPRRWARPPSSAVRAYPPHAIRAGGVGPYRVGMPLSEALHLLPEGPRVELLQLGELARWRVVRAEGDALLFGAGEDNKVAFVSVVTGPVARTETGGLGVGVTGAELLAAIGPERPSQVAWDRRVFELEVLPGVLFISDAPPDAPPARATIVAIVVTTGSLVPAEAAPPPPPAPPPVAAPAGECRAGGRLAASVDEIVAFGQPVSGQPARSVRGRPLVRFGCVTGTTPEAITVGPGVLELIGGEPGHLKRLARVALPAAHVVAPIDVDGDGRDEIVVAVLERGPAARVVAVTVLDWDGARLATRSSGRPIVITASAAAAAGTTLAALDLALSFRPLGADLELGGFYLTRRGTAVEVAAPLVPVRIRLGRRDPHEGASRTTGQAHPGAPTPDGALAPAARPVRRDDGLP